MWFRRKAAAVEPAPVERDDNPIVSGMITPSRASIIDDLCRSTFKSPPPITGVAMDSVGGIAPFAKLDSGFGGMMPTNQLSWYGSQGFIGYQACAVLAQNWLIDKACTMPARDAVRHGFEISAGDGKDLSPDVLTEIGRLNRAYGLKKNMIEFIRKGKIFGIRIAMFVIDGIDYSAPFNIDGVRPNSYRGIRQIDPYWITPCFDAPSMSDPTSITYYEPSAWMVRGIKIHASHLLIYRNSELPDALKPAYMWGGVSVPQRIAERVYAAERTANEAPLLAMTKRTSVYKGDIGRAISNPAEFDARMEAWQHYRDNHGIKIADFEEEYQQFDTSLANLDETIMTQYQLVAAAANVPATKILGTSPKGFNASGEYEESSYNQELESIQENDLTPLVDRHLQLVMASCLNLKGRLLEIEWHPVDSPTALEQADINLKKAQTGSALAMIGAVDGEDERNRLIADKASGYNGLADRKVEPLDLGNEDDGKQE